MTKDGVTRLVRSAGGVEGASEGGSEESGSTRREDTVGAREEQVLVVDNGGLAELPAGLEATRGFIEGTY